MEFVWVSYIRGTPVMKKKKLDEKYNIKITDLILELCNSLSSMSYFSTTLLTCF